MTAIPRTDPDGQLAIGEPAPDWTLTDTVTGKIINFRSACRDAKGAVVIFSCNHCPWVIKYEPRMIELAHAYRNKGIPFFLISVNDVVNYPQDRPEEMKRRALDKGYPFPYLYDESQKTARDYGAKVTPHPFLFDADLKLCYRGRIDDNADQEPRPTRAFLRDAIEMLLTGQSPQGIIMPTSPVGCSIKWK